MTLAEQWWAIYTDMRGKMARGDWHGVRDACVDLEIMEVKIRLCSDEKVPTPP